MNLAGFLVENESKALLRLLGGRGIECSIYKVYWYLDSLQFIVLKDFDWLSGIPLENYLMTRFALEKFRKTLNYTRCALDEFKKAWKCRKTSIRKEKERFKALHVFSEIFEERLDNISFSMFTKDLEKARSLATRSILDFLEVFEANGATSDDMIAAHFTFMDFAWALDDLLSTVKEEERLLKSNFSLSETAAFCRSC